MEHGRKKSPPEIVRGGRDYETCLRGVYLAACCVKRGQPLCGLTRALKNALDGVFGIRGEIGFLGVENAIAGVGFIVVKFHLVGGV